MRVRTLFLLIFAITAAGGTYFLAQNWITNQRGTLSRVANAEAPTLTPMVEVLVASSELMAGQFIKAEHLRWQPWPKNGMAETYFVKGDQRSKQTVDGKPAKSVIENFVGSVVRGRISRGEPITDGRIVRPGDRGFLAAVLKPDTRAISVPINATTGISGFVFPGDRVDLLLTHSIPGAKGTAPRRATETVLSDIRVLAVDQRTGDTETKAELAKTATLEVTPTQAEIIAVAIEMGRLSLSLRSLAQTGGSEKTARERRKYTWDTDASRLISRKPHRPESAESTVRVFRGSVGTTVKFGTSAGRKYRIQSSAPAQGTTDTSEAATPRPLNIASRKINR